MIILKIIFLFLFLKIFLDFYFNKSLKSNLVLLPLDYKYRNKDKNSEVIINLKIINKSKHKETMVSNLNLDLDFFQSKNNQYLKDLDYEESIYIYSGSIKKNIYNYWPTTIIKANSELLIQVILKFKNSDLKNKIKYIWLKIFWENYGHFGITKKQDGLLVNLNRHNKKELIEIPLKLGYKAIAVKTDLLGSFDNPIETVMDYCKNVTREKDILTIGETPLAIMQGRYVAPQNLEYNIFSKILCYFFHPTSSLATACGMQLLVDKIGVMRITFSLILGFLFKCIGIKGIFYRLTGFESSLIDDISGTVVPYDKSIVMGPINTKLFCDKLSKQLKVEVAVVDVNDLGGVKILASSNNSVNNLLKEILKVNPAGNSDEKTPIVLIRNNI
ncbi:conserved hypothetical protein [Prochlorococcus marinus subsp. pastoris str. CCMP1986]|uniref:ABC-type sugar transport system n=1 Tax=Prochlorococcus marinus subsp. pastoris (strain CCMP1986 / NIES-2087 / MED4) TaxID=59919 RepID=Q7V1R2_PROMP|nr:hypothetical protein PROCH_1319 [Prochlorococcus marinus str. EQPAC1]CAE19252.1 conserved hypothetical protein [Prochlorococcus marinus subsp. pastoris str. CCMP1986]